MTYEAATNAASEGVSELPSALDGAPAPFLPPYPAAAAAVKTAEAALREFTLGTLSTHVTIHSRQRSQAKARTVGTRSVTWHKQASERATGRQNLVSGKAKWR